MLWPIGIPTYALMAASSREERKANAGFAALWRFIPMLWPKGEPELVRVHDFNDRELA